MRWVVFSFVAVLTSAGCRSTGLRPEHPPWSYVADVRSLPISFSLEEIVTRTWGGSPGEPIVLLGREVFEVNATKPRKVLAATYGFASSKHAVCIDFYAMTGWSGGAAYLLLCHDEDCPPKNTRVRCETQGSRVFFRISGDYEESDSSKSRSVMYYYELNPKCQMVKGFSTFISGPGQFSR